MEAIELFLASPGTDFNSGRVSIGGYLAIGAKQSNLTVNNYTGMVGINSIKAGRSMTISLPFDGPQNILSFDIATTLPVNT